jgi:PST family polysaccharide transporter
MSLLLYAFAPWIVRTILGVDFQPAVGALKILFLLPPILAISAGIGFLWMLPNEHERKCIPIIASGLISNVLLAVVLVPSRQHIGMAVAVVLSECLVMVSFLRYYFAGLQALPVLKDLRASNE